MVSIDQVLLINTMTLPYLVDKTMSQSTRIPMRPNPDTFPSTTHLCRVTNETGPTHVWSHIQWNQHWTDCFYKDHLTYLFTITRVDSSCPPPEQNRFTQETLFFGYFLWSLVVLRPVQVSLVTVIFLLSQVLKVTNEVRIRWHVKMVSVWWEREVQGYVKSSYCMETVRC